VAALTVCKSIGFFAHFHILINTNFRADILPAEETEDKDEEAEEPWMPYIPEKPSPILHGFHAKDEGKFWLSMVRSSLLALL
jgi:hypothetical protein